MKESGDKEKWKAEVHLDGLMEKYTKDSLLTIIEVVMEDWR